MTIEQRLTSLETRVTALEPTILTSPPPRVALVLGHHRRFDSGAISTHGISEITYNTPVIKETEHLLKQKNITTLTYLSSDATSYSSAVDELVSKLRFFKPDLAIELHFNAYDSTASQEEYLYWHTSSKSKDLATALLNSHNALDPNPVTRGIKPITSGQRGSLILQKSPCPYVICEPFFGDNHTDWNFWRINQPLLAKIYSSAILDYLFTS